MLYRVRDMPVKTNESYGVVQNISNDIVEISNNESFTNSFLLYPARSEKFTGQIYIRPYEATAQLIKVNVVNFVGGNGNSNLNPTTSESEIASDDEVTDYLEDIFNNN